MLGGIVQSILSGLSNLIMSILETIVGTVIELITKYVIAPLISLIISLISYVLSIFFYNIACFILALIDYVEVMFRLLAGLEVDGVQLNLGSSSEKGGDLVLQLIRTPEIRDAFLAMVVVGMFLLIITTIFQMIKVEYTTEGAKNAKGPILNKAFKGMANMIMLPALCVFGVFIGNQVLDLLDKATKPDTNTGQSATISGTLFVAASSDAFYRKNETTVVLASTEPTLAATSLVVQLHRIVWNSAIKAFDDTFDDVLDQSFEKSESERRSYESQIASGAISYWNVGEITKIYNYSKINYLLLIFGGCIVIKTLYATCFGMIVRLYQCGMLFIISPAVIGMTPINEGGLGKWRSSFIGQVLSAYGVVLALNIFFILVRVLLSIDFNFTSWNSYFFGASMMEGLLKAIIVIGGALSIEKFAKEIGGYFGAADALSQGKEMQKAVGDTAKKAVSTAVTVAMAATGAGGAAVGAAKGLGAAMKAGKAMNAVQGKKGGAMKGAMNYIGDGIMDKGTDALQTAMDYSGINADVKGAWLQHRGNKANALEDKSLNSAIALRDSGTDAEEKNLADKREILKNMRDNKRGGMMISDAEMQKAERDVKMAEGQLAFKQKAIADAEKNIDTIGNYTKSRKFSEADAEARKVTHGDEQILRRESARQAGKALWSQTTIGGAFAGAKKTVSGYNDAAAKEGGKEVTAAYEHIKKIKSDADEEAAENRNKKVITEKNIVQAGIIKKMTVEEVEVSNKKLDIMRNSGLSNLNALQKEYNAAKDNNDTIRMQSLESQMQSARAGLAQSLGVGVGSISQDINGNFQVTEDYHIDTKGIEAMMEKMIKNGGMNNKAAMQEAINEAIKGKTADQTKLIQEIFEKVVAKYQK